MKYRSRGNHWIYIELIGLKRTTMSCMHFRSVSIFYLLLIRFILHLFYLSNQIAMTGYLFAIYCQWARYSISGLWFLLNDGKKREKHKRGLHRRHHQKPIRTKLVSAIGRLFGGCCGLFTLQDKYNIRLLSDNTKFIGSLFFLSLTM
jgi:hypothetical protein